MINLVFTLTLAALVHPGVADIEGRRPGVDVERYRFEIVVNDSTDVIYGRADVDIQFTDTIDSFFLDLVSSAADGAGMHVSEILLDARSVDFRHAGDRLSIQTAGVAAGDRCTYTIVYEGKPADGLIIATNKFGERTFFGDNWPNRARNWLPTVDHVSDKAHVEWIVTMPEHYEAVANGELLEQVVGDDGTRTMHWRTIAPIPTKVMVIGVARFSIEHRGEVEGVPVQTWVYPSDTEAGFADFSVADSMLRYFLANVGEYPYAKLANVESTTRYGGMENAGAIFYAEQAVTGNRGNEATVAHEIAHQWFGNSVTEGDWHHVWLSEGFATYFTNLYWEHAYGRDRMERRLRAQREAVINYSRSNPNSPVVDVSITDPNDLLSPNSYQKGGWVLHMLRNEIGDEGFWAGIRAYYARHRDANAITEDLRDVMETASGADLEAFFDQWIYRPGQPRLELDWTAHSGTAGGEIVTIRVTQLQPEPFDFPLEIGIDRRSGGRSIERVRVHERSHTFEVEVDEGVRMVEFDPKTNLLFERVGG